MQNTNTLHHHVATVDPLLKILGLALIASPLLRPIAAALGYLMGLAF